MLVVVMKEKYKSIGALVCLLAAGMTVYGAYNLQQEAVLLQLNDKSAKTWVFSKYERERKIKDMEQKAKILMVAAAVLLVWPVAREIKRDVIDVERQIRYREIKQMRKHQGR